MVAEIEAKYSLDLCDSSFKSKKPVEHTKEENTKYIVKDRLFKQSSQLEGIAPRPQSSAGDGSGGCSRHAQNGAQGTQQSIVECLIQLMEKTQAVDDILHTAVELIGEAVRATCCLTWQIDSNKGLKFCYLSQSTEPENLLRLSSELSDYYSSILSKGITLSVSQEKEKLPPALRAAMQVSQVGSFALAPLFRDTYRGEICLYHSQKERQWTEDELKVVRNVATQCAIAIEQVQLAEKVQQQQAKEQLLKQINRTINSSLESEQILQKILERVGESLSLDQIVLFRQNDKELQIQGEWQAAQTSPDLSTQSRLGECANDASRAVAMMDENRQNGSSSLNLLDYTKIQRVAQAGCAGYGSILSVPVFIRGQFFGSLLLQTSESQTFTASEISLVESVADQIAIALHSAQNIECCKELQVRTQKLEAEKQRVESANRAKSQFLSVMNHELRSPLSGIIGFSRMLVEEIYGTLNKKQMQYVSTIVEYSEYLLDLINDLLDISKIEAEKEELFLEKVPVEDLCLSSLSIVQERAKQAGLELKLEIAADVSFCIADQRRLKQILVNLLTNAVKFTGAGGSVTLEVRQEETLQFSVIDTGIGISESDREKLFQPFSQISHRLNREHKGTGLGLALSRKLAKLHGGDITLVSEEGKGSCFTVHLPLESYRLQVEGCGL